MQFCLTLPLQATLVNNLKKIISPESGDPGLHFRCWQSANFRTVLSKSENTQNPWNAEAKTDFNSTWPFKVIYFGVSEKPQRDYILQYNNCGFVLEGMEDTASERSENHYFQRPQSHLTSPFQQTATNIRISLSRQKLGSLCYIFAMESICLPSFEFLWCSEKRV